jgi:nickel superoxide dismutase
MFLFKSNRLILYMVVSIVIFINSSLFAHCQIPCGIYNDEMRFRMIEEHITTIEKSMNQIITLSKEGETNYNQLIRWVINKEEHANKIQEIVNAYFLTQRIKPVDIEDKEAYNGYTKKLTLLHRLLYYAMKAKQTIELTYVEEMRSLLSQFHELYFNQEEKDHLKKHQ